MKKFDQYCSNLSVLSRAGNEDLNNEFIIGGIIDKFYVQFELGWKVMKELLKYEGVPVAASGSPREIIKAAYRYFGFMDEETWLGMLRAGNDMTHLYNAKAARELVYRIIDRYTDEFIRMKVSIEEMYKGVLDRIR